MRSTRMVCLAGTVLAVCAASAWANVYPAQVTITPAGPGVCDTVAISYVLNENADGDGVGPGVTIQIFPAGGNPDTDSVRTVHIPTQKKGPHEYEWDGRDDNGARVANGSYEVRITARDLGYTAWTQINTDGAATNFWVPAGVTVNKNESSDNYGKVYVSNAVEGSPSASGRLTKDGFYRLNADMTTDGPDDGYFDGGRVWTGAVAPWRATIGQDDHLYVTDFSVDLAFEITSDTTNVQLIDASNKTADQYVAAIHVEGTQAGGDREIYLVDQNYYASAPGRKGLIQYTLGAQAAATPGDIGVQYIGQNVWNTFYPTDIARDSAGDWYSNTFRSSPNQAPALKKFLDGPPPISAPAWEVASSFTGAYCVDVYEPNGWVAYGGYYDGFIHLFQMSDGAHIASFDAGSRMRDIAFDTAGNLYTADNIIEWVRVWSPPNGPNSKATTRAFALNKSGTGGPSITAQPQDQQFCVGDDVSFGVTATGTNLTYQWKKNGTLLVDDGGVTVSGATTANLMLHNVPADDNGAVVSVRVCDDNGVVVSNYALMNVGVSFLAPPTAQSICQGGDATFSVVAAGKGNLSYQWEKDTGGDNNFQPIPGENGTSVTVSNLTNGTKVRVVVTDDCGPVASPAATVVVSTGPAVAAVAFDNTYAAGHTGTVNLIVNASGSGTLHYKWFHNGVEIPGAADLNSYPLSGPALDPLTCADAGAYTVEVTDDCGSVHLNDAARTAQIVITGVPEICDNGEDDDCDGLVDCDDEDCAAQCCNTPWADAEGPGGVGLGLGDGDIDLNDFAIFQQCYSGAIANYPAIPEYCTCFDRDENGRIDAADFDAFKLCAGEGSKGAGVPGNCP